LQFHQYLIAITASSTSAFTYYVLVLLIYSIHLIST